MNVKRSSSSIAATAVVERAGMRLAIRAALFLERGEVVVGEDELQRGQLVVAPVELRALRLVLAEDPDRLRVRDDVRGVLRRGVRVDRGADGADVREREVEEGPLERRAREDREGVALADAAGEQSVRQQLDAVGRVRPRDLLPAVGPLDEVRGARVAGHGVAPEAGDGAITGHPDGMYPGREHGVQRESRPSRPRLWENYARQLERIPELRPRRASPSGLLRPRSPPHGSRTCRSGCSTASA